MSPGRLDRTFGFMLTTVSQGRHIIFSGHTANYLGNLCIVIRDFSFVLTTLRVSLLVCFQRLCMFVFPSTSVLSTIEFKKIACYMISVILIVGVDLVSSIKGFQCYSFSGLSCWFFSVLQGDFDNDVKTHINLLWSVQTQPTKSPKKMRIAICSTSKIRLYHHLKDAH